MKHAQTYTLKLCSGRAIGFVLCVFSNRTYFRNSQESHLPFVVLATVLHHNLANHSSSISTDSICFVETPSRSSLSLSQSNSPSIKSIGGAPSLVASFIASRVNEPVVIKRPLSARPCIAPRKSRISPGETDFLYFLH